MSRSTWTRPPRPDYISYWPSAGGERAAHLGRQRDGPSPDAMRPVTVSKVLMVHPYWDMALLRVDGLADVRPLPLGVDPPDALTGREVAAVGYPALDSRNDF